MPVDPILTITLTIPSRRCVNSSGLTKMGGATGDESSREELSREQ